MNKLETLLNELRLIVNSPKIYLINHFNEIRNQIDLECQIYLCGDDLSTERKEQATQIQVQMINEVDLVQQKCLTNLETITFNGQVNMKVLEQCFEGLNLEETDGLLKLEKEVYISLYQRQKLIFMNQGVLFFSIKSLLKLLDFPGVYLQNFDSTMSSVLFGILIIIENDFLLFKDTFQTTLNEKKLDTDWCNEFLRIYLMRASLRESFSDQNFEIVNVNRIELNLSQVKKLSLDDYTLNKLLINDWIVELPALTSIFLSDCQLEFIEPTTFRNLMHLEVLDLSSNSLKKLDSRLFSSNKNLTQLSLQQNQISDLAGDIFKGLSKLMYLFLEGNSIEKIPEGIFEDLASLNTLNLSNNEIAFSDENEFPHDRNIFKGLNKLINLDLNYNQITVIPGGSFQDLVSLEDFTLKYNKIRFLQNKQDTSIFKGLGKLTYLDLSYNDIGVIPAGTFQGLDRLESFSLENNKIIFLDNHECEQILLGLWELIYIDLSCNKIDVIPGGIFRSLRSLKTLILNQNEIRSLDKTAFSSLRDLKYLYLSNNMISEIPVGLFGNLGKLIELGLESNEIKFYGEEGCQQDPTIFKGLTSLKTLRLAKNGFYSSEESARFVPEGLFQYLVDLESCDIKK